MMNDREIFVNLIKNTISEMQDTIDTLYVSCNSCTKNLLLNACAKIWPRLPCWYRACRATNTRLPAQAQTVRCAIRTKPSPCRALKV
jgi:hypothetical protein